MPIKDRCTVAAVQAHVLGPGHFLGDLKIDIRAPEGNTIGDCEVFAGRVGVGGSDAFPVAGHHAAEIERDSKQTADAVFEKQFVLPFHRGVIQRRGIKARAATGFLKLILH